ncbi:MAG: RNA methyltransferase [Balneolaceae bacterium]
MQDSTRKELIDYLKGFTTEARLDKFEEVLSKRTKHISVVLEDLHKPHNANAVLRSCEALGIQDIHIIENENEFDTEGQVSIGAHQWLTLNRYNEDSGMNVETCFESLRKEGYKIIATTPHENDSNINELDISEKTALVFGGELTGISDKVKEQADGFVKIPMYGFSESFNISVSAAISLYDVTSRLRATGLNWGLSEKEKEVLTLDWLIQTIKAGEKLVEKFMNEQEAGD